jgi:hypothetical protein
MNRIFSFGGGVQSVAVLVLAAQRRLAYDAFVFANVGANSENPDTLVYFEQVAKPYALKHDIELVEVSRRNRKGQAVSLLDSLYSAKRSVNIPVRMSNGAPGRRNCTGDFKIAVVARWLRENGATVEKPATVGLGISIDEFQRMNQSRIDWQVNEYPLIDMNLSRRDCRQLIMSAGLPVPPKSSCWFCPYKNREDWQQLRNHKPDLFAAAVSLEQYLNGVRRDLGRDAVYLHSSCIPLVDVVGNQLELGLEEAACESGYCFV